MVAERTFDQRSTNRCHQVHISPSASRLGTDLYDPKDASALRCNGFDSVESAEVHRTSAGMQDLCGNQ